MALLQFRGVARRVVAGVLAAGAVTVATVGIAPAASAHGSSHDHVSIGRCVATLTAGEQTWTGVVDGVERTAQVYVPASALTAVSLRGHRDGLALLVALHGSNNTPAMLLDLAELRQSADQHGNVVIAPQGAVPGANPGTWAWNVPGVTTVPAGTPDDVSFLAQLVSTVRSQYCIDPDQVFATGYSGGGRMISAVACERPGVFDAIAPVVGLRAGTPVQDESGAWVPDASSCSPRVGTPVITFTGTADPINPAAGGGAPYWQYGAQAAVDGWTAINRCHATRVRTVSATVTRSTALGCARGNDVVSYVIDGAGHTWPGGNAAMLTAYASVLGPYTDAVDANDVMWQFFRTHA